MTESALVALTRTNIEGFIAVVASFVLFGGTVYVLLSAIFGPRMGYLVAATGFFAFMIILSALWAFGAPGTPPYLGPKGELPTWIAVAEGERLTSPDIPVDEYPEGPWRTPQESGMAGEAEPASLAFQEFLAEEAAAQLRSAGIEGEITPEDFQIEDLRFATVDGTDIAAARGFAAGGGPEVMVVGYRDPGNESLPSYLFLVGSLIGFAAHLPFLDRAERRRREVLTGGDQQPWRGPA